MSDLKKQGKTLSLINVNPSVYEILRMTGLVNLIHVERALRKVSVEGLPLIGEGITASVYRLDDEKVNKVEASSECVSRSAKRSHILMMPLKILFVSHGNIQLFWRETA